MNIKQLEKKAREVTPKWLQDEIDWLLETIEIERADNPESWGEYDFFEILFNTYAFSDLGKTRAFKLATTKVERHIGVQRKVTKDEEIWHHFPSGRCKRYSEGDWIFDKRWQDLITE
jgi:hypothetical protein